MKNVCIVSAMGQYENIVKYLKANKSNDENHLIIIKLSSFVIAEKILTSDDILFWKKVHIFEPVKNATNGMNTVKLNRNNTKFSNFLERNDLLNVDAVYFGVVPKLPLYNSMPKMFPKGTELNLIEDGSATYMLHDDKIFEYMVMPGSKSIKNNKNLIKNKKKSRPVRGENRRMLANTIWYSATGNKLLPKKQYRFKWNDVQNFDKLIINSPELYTETDSFKFKQIERFDFSTTMTKEEVNSDSSATPIYFDQSFGIPVWQHVQILDQIFQNRGIDEIIIKLHPKSSKKYMDEFKAPEIVTNFILETRAISGEELLKEKCPETIYGINSTVLLNAINITNIEFIFGEYLSYLDDGTMEQKYYNLMFMARSSENLERMINRTTTKYPIKCRKSVLFGLKQPKPTVKQEKQIVEDDSIFNQPNRSAHQKKLDKGVLNYLKLANHYQVDQKKIFFEAYKGMYGCSPKEIYLYLKTLPQYSDYTFVWSRSANMDPYSQIELEEDENTIVVNYASPEYFEQIGKSKLIITNQRLHKKFFRREGQYVLQTWHGTPFKKDALSISINTHNVSNSHRIEINTHDVQNYSYFLMQNEFSNIELASTFMLEDFPDVEILKSGYPRNCRLVEEISEEQINQLKDKYKIPRDKKILFYTPTWRDHHKKNPGGINDIFDFDAWQEALADEWIILFRGHYFHKKAVNLENYKGFIFDTTKYNDLNDFYLISDLLVTDYSSSFFDYLNLKKPILFYMPDFVAYIKLSRKLHFEPETDLPGPVSYELSDFLENVGDFENVTSPYVEKFDQFIEEFCSWDKGATERLVKLLEEKNSI